MKEDQLTLRLPRDLSRALARRALERRVPKSQLVREALQGYLQQGDDLAPDPQAAVERFRGAAPLDRAALERDALARQIRRHNWRK